MTAGYGGGYPDRRGREDAYDGRRQQVAPPADPYGLEPLPETGQRGQRPGGGPPDNGTRWPGGQTGPQDRVPAAGARPYVGRGAQPRPQQPGGWGPPTGPQAPVRGMPPGPGVTGPQPPVRGMPPAQGGAGPQSPVRGMPAPGGTGPQPPARGGPPVPGGPQPGGRRLRGRARGAGPQPGMRGSQPGGRGPGTGPQQPPPMRGGTGPQPPMRGAGTGPQPPGRGAGPQQPPARGQQHPGRGDDGLFVGTDEFAGGRLVPGMEPADEQADNYGGFWAETDAQESRGGKGRKGGDKKRPGKKPRRFRWMAPVIALLVIFVPLAVAGFFGYKYWHNKYHPADFAGAGTGPAIVVQVNSGDTATSLAPRLQTDGVVASSRAFVIAAENSKSKATLEAGTFKLNRHMQATLAYQMLINPANRVQAAVTLPEGLRAVNVLTVISRHSTLSLSKLQQAAANVGQLGLPPYAKGKIEGYLFPATYNIQPKESATQALQAMVHQFNLEAAKVHLTQGAGRLGMTASQLITVASLVQAEGGRLVDYPKIAEVVYNRLKVGMKLQFDSTVFYGLHKYGTAANATEISTPGPYNTYLNHGLPPGPIANPGNAAIQAALHPATGNDLYFFSFKNGKTIFSHTPLPQQSH